MLRGNNGRIRGSRQSNGIVSDRGAEKASVREVPAEPEMSELVTLVAGPESLLTTPPFLCAAVHCVESSENSKGNKKRVSVPC